LPHQFSNVPAFRNREKATQEKAATPPRTKLRQVDVLVSQGQNMVDAIRQIGVSEVTYYRWRGVRWAEDRAGEAPEGP
jgi:hypothetical protein